jgi:hypothetical protein
MDGLASSMANATAGSRHLTGVEAESALETAMQSPVKRFTGDESVSTSPLLLNCKHPVEIPAEPLEARLKSLLI